jgi:hypothetical protein
VALTADERGYATRFTESLGADGLKQLTLYAHDAALAATPAPLAAGHRDNLVNARYESTLAPFGRQRHRLRRDPRGPDLPPHQPRR